MTINIFIMLSTEHLQRVFVSSLYIIRTLLPPKGVVEFKLVNGVSDNLRLIA